MSSYTFASMHFLWKGFVYFSIRIREMFWMTWRKSDLNSGYIVITSSECAYSTVFLSGIKLNSFLFVYLSVWYLKLEMSYLNERGFRQVGMCAFLLIGKQPLFTIVCFPTSRKSQWLFPRRETELNICITITDSSVFVLFWKKKMQADIETGATVSGKENLVSNGGITRNSCQQTI